MIIVACVALAAATEVVPITTATAEDTLSSGRWFVKFYAPWCGHCQRLEPTWISLADAAAASGADFKVAEVDCTVETDLCKVFGIRGYPTLNLLDGETMYAYRSERSAEALLTFAMEGYKNAPEIPVPKLHELSVKSDEL